MLAEDDGEAVLIVVSDKPAEVLVARHFDIFAGEDFTKRLEMKRLGVGEGAVEVEDDRANQV